MSFFRVQSKKIYIRLYKKKYHKNLKYLRDLHSQIFPMVWKGIGRQLLCVGINLSVQFLKGSVQFRILSTLALPTLALPTLALNANGNGGTLNACLQRHSQRRSSYRWNAVHDEIAPQSSECLVERLTSKLSTLERLAYIPFSFFNS